MAFIELSEEQRQMLMNIVTQTSIALPPEIQNRSEMSLAEMQTIGNVLEVQKIQGLVGQLTHPLPPEIEKKVVELLKPPATPVDTTKTATEVAKEVTNG